MGGPEAALLACARALCVWHDSMPGAGDAYKAPAQTRPAQGGHARCSLPAPRQAKWLCFSLLEADTQLNTAHCTAAAAEYEPGAIDLSTCAGRRWHPRARGAGCSSQGWTLR